MPFDRRNFLKLFGAGATIVPLIAGVPEIASPAKLVEIPKIDPVILVPSIRPMRDLLSALEPYLITVDVVRGQERYRFRAKSFVTEYNVRSLDVTRHGSTHREEIPILGNIEWTLRGICTGNPTVLFDT